MTRLTEIIRQRQVSYLKSPLETPTESLPIPGHYSDQKAIVDTVIKVPPKKPVKRLPAPEHWVFDPKPYILEQQRQLRVLASVDWVEGIFLHVVLRMYVSVLQILADFTEQDLYLLWRPAQNASEQGKREAFESLFELH